MRLSALILLAALVAIGCASDSIARRKQERLAAYANLPVSQQVAVDQGQLLHGMSTNAAYIAWGRPSEIVSEGPTMTWIYREQEFKEHKHVTVYPMVAEEVKTPYARTVVRAQIIFENGSVTSWSRIPQSNEERFR
jgi:hypothetical protein